LEAKSNLFIYALPYRDFTAAFGYTVKVRRFVNSFNFTIYNLFVLGSLEKL
jgi:hypothetical protein